MVSIDELDLPHLAMEEPAFAENPYPHFAAARSQHSWLAASTFGYVVTSYSAVRNLCAINKMRTAYDHLVDFMGARGTAWGRFQEGHMLGKNGEAHKRVRDILAPAFTPRQADLHRPLMREVISTLLDEWAPKAAFDFEEFASYFPVTVMCNLIGASPKVLPGIRSSMEALALSVSMDPALLDQLQGAIVHLDRFVHELMAQRERDETSRETPDLLDILLKAKCQGGMTEQELADLLIFLFAAGFDTSKNILTLTMHEMIKHPEIYQRCAEDLAYCRKVIDESMRFHSVTTTNRIVTENIEYRDVLLPAGTNLWFPWSVIARDPEAAENPDDFNPDRPQKNRHLGFALGAHMCLGQFIARAQLEEGLHQIAQRITRPRSPGPRGWRPFPGVWGICGLPIEFDPAAARE